MRVSARALAVAVMATVLLTSGLVVLLLRGGGADAAEASSAQGGHGADQVLAGVDGDWRSDDETVGAWVELRWDASTDVSRVVLERGDPRSPGVTEGYLAFSDGSQVHVAMAGSRLVVPISAREVDRMRFTVTGVADGATSVSLAELTADDDEAASDGVATAARGSGDVATAAVVTGASGDSGALVDDDPDTATTVGSSIDLRWDRPRELVSVSLAGATDGAALAGATLVFSDGSTLPLGGVTTDASRPTTIAFMPRVTTSLRIVLGEVAGGGTPVLSGLWVRQRGAAALGPVTARGLRPLVRDDADDCELPGTRPDDETGLVVLCPTVGAVVDDQVQITVAVGPSFSAVTAAAWPAVAQADVGETVEAEVDAAGTATLDLDVSSLPGGPFTVAVGATGAGSLTAAAYLQLARHGSVPASDAPVPAGRTLVYADEFDHPVSITRSGVDATYTAGKPTDTGVEDFGDAIFADPALGLHNVEVVGGGLLRMSVQPRPEELTDPQGWGREHVGALLASARQGGSGFSAQYGYFEARMLAPAAPGTWPAFWLLSNPNLATPQRFVSEIDAVELYGHDPTSACHTSHQYPDPDGVGEADCGRRWDSVREATAWHTYGVDVRPTKIIYFIDGREVASAPQVAGGADPMFFLLDLALGGGWPVGLGSLRERADLYVDWVRISV